MVYTLATDARSASRFAGFVPIIGSPHYGCNLAPVNAPAPFFALWGTSDITVPPLPREYPDDPCLGANDNERRLKHPYLAFDTAYSGYYYQAYPAVLAKWGAANGCPNAEPENIPRLPSSLNKRWTCYGWAKGECASQQASVIGCLFPGGHVIPTGSNTAIFEFMQAHELDLSTPTPAPTPALGESNFFQELVGRESSLPIPVECRQYCRDNPVTRKRSLLFGSRQVACVCPPPLESPSAATNLESPNQSLNNGWRALVRSQ